MTVLVEVTQTARSFGRNQEWFRYGVRTHRFDDLTDAFEWIKENYEKKRRAAIYQDTNTNGTIQTGWIYSGRDENNYTQDWVSLSEVMSETEKTCRSIDVSKVRRTHATYYLNP